MRVATRFLVLLSALLTLGLLNACGDANSPTRTGAAGARSEGGGKGDPDASGGVGNSDAGVGNATAAGGVGATSGVPTRGGSSAGGMGAAGAVGGAQQLAGASGMGGGSSWGDAPTGSGLPNLPTGGIPKPAGGSDNLKVLDWAGLPGAASYSFDDTQPSQVEHWAELRDLGVRLTFYANPTGSWFTNYEATWKEAVQRGSELGNHTVNHCYADLKTCPSEKPPLASQELELDQCSSYVTGTLGQSEVWSVAYPYGDTAWESYSKERFLLGRGVSRGMVAPQDTTDPWLLPIAAANGGETAEFFNGYLDTAGGAHQWVIFMLHSILPTQYNWYAGVDIGSISGSVAYGKSKWIWIDSVVNIGAYWLGQRLLSGTVPTVSGQSKTWTWNLPAHFPKGKYLRVTVAGGTLTQGSPLAWNDQGYYEVALDQGTLTWSP